MQRVSFHTLGCKLNQSETGSLAEEFRQRGYEIVPFGHISDVTVINTCTVTAKADYRCRQSIRRAIRQSPDAKIAVVGCYAQTDSDAIQQIEGVDIVLGSDRKFELFDYLDSQSHVHRQATNHSFVNTHPGLMEGKTRAFIKIQDGCDSYCSYCIVPYARGHSRSAATVDLIRTVKSVADQGYQEVVLTGVHIGKFGLDTQPAESLAILLKRLLAETAITRIRLSSLEPLELSDEIIALAAGSNRICNHFHIPLQSGDDDVLRAMNRNYSRQQFSAIIHRLVEKIPEAGLGTDVIVGYPGESDEQFQHSYDLISELPFTYLHVFNYSVRPGTVAANSGNMVPKQLKKKRSAALIELAMHKKKQFYKNATGKSFPVLFEERNDNLPMMSGFSDHYLRVKTETQPEYFNKIVNTKIVDIDSEQAVGIIDV